MTVTQRPAGSGTWTTGACMASCPDCPMATLMLASVGKTHPLRNRSTLSAAASGPSSRIRSCLSVRPWYRPGTRVDT